MHADSAKLCASTELPARTLPQHAASIPSELESGLPEIFHSVQLRQNTTNFERHGSWLHGCRSQTPAGDRLSLFVFSPRKGRLPQASRKTSRCCRRSDNRDRLL